MASVARSREQAWQRMDEWLQLYGRDVRRCTASVTPSDAASLQLFVAAYGAIVMRPRQFLRAKDRAGWLCAAVQREAGIRPSSSRVQRKPSGDDEVYSHSVLAQAAHDPSVQDVEVSEPWRLAVAKHVYALYAQELTEQARRGPWWTVGALWMTGIVGLTGVVYGGRGLEIATRLRALPATSSTGDHQLPLPLDNLPTTPVAQFRLPDNPPFPSLTKIAVSQGELFLPTVAFPANANPKISVNAVALNEQGRSLGAAMRGVGDIALAPPKGSSLANYSLSAWSFAVTSGWAMVTATWTPVSGDVQGNILQLYGLQIRTHRATLLRTFADVADQANEYVIAVGEGRVIVQSGLTGAAGSSQQSVGLPVQIFTLRGTNFTAPLTSSGQISGLFGFMIEPTVTESGIVFQAIQDQVETSASVNAMWGEVAWDGTLTRYVGPPLDNRPHWLVQSSGSGLWWAETTPDESVPGNYVQVLMGQLSSTATSAQSADLTLSGPVAGFGVAGRYLVWEQTTGGVPQLVVSEVSS